MATKYKQPRIIEIIEKNRQTGSHVVIDFSMNENGHYQASCYGPQGQTCGFYVNTCTYESIMRIGRTPLEWCPSCQERHHDIKEVA